MDLTFEFSNLAIGSVVAVTLTLGIVQAVKEMLGWDGNKVKLLSIAVGTIIGAVAIAFNQGMFSDSLEPYIMLIFGALAFGLSASGYYSLAKK